MKTHPTSLLSLRVASVDAIFDSRDAHDLPVRRIDSDWLEYVLEVMDDQPSKGSIDLSLLMKSDTLSGWNSQDVVDSLRRELSRRESFLTLKLRENFKLGRTSLILGLFVLVFFILLSVISSKIFSGTLRDVFHEGFMIIGWVALWRPVEILLYDWWPITQERRKIRRLLAGKVTVETV